MTQCFYMRRIYLLSNHPVVKWSIPALLSPLISWQLVGNIIYVTRGLTFQLNAQLTSLNKIQVAVNASAAAVDIITALTACILLYRSRTQMPATNRLIGSLIISSINTGAWTALFATIAIALIVSNPDYPFYGITHLPLCALYCNSLLGTLISRNLIRRTGQHTTASNSIPLYTVSVGRVDQSLERKAEVGQEGLVFAHAV